MSIGARMHTTEEASALVRAFVSTDFSGDSRHQRRIDMLSRYEATREIPDAPDADRVGVES